MAPNQDEQIEPVEYLNSCRERIPITPLQRKDGKFILSQEDYLKFCSGDEIMDPSDQEEMRLGEA